MTWKSRRLSEITEVITKGTTPTTLGYAFAEEGIPFLRVQNINRGSVNYERDTLFIDQVTHDELSRSHIKPGDVLVSIAGTIGRAGVVRDNAPALNCNQAVAIVRPSQHIFRSFLRLWIESLDAQRQMRSSTVTGTIANLSLTQLGNLEIPLPPMAEQQRIAEVLDRAEALRTKRRAALVQLDSLTQSVFEDAFGDPLSNPKRIKTAKLSSLCLRVTDGTHQPPKWSAKGLPFLFVSNIVSGEITFNTEKFISHQTHLELTRRCPIEVGDVLYSTVGSYGVPAIVRSERKFAFQRHIAHLKPERSLLDSEFLAAMLASPPLKRQADRAAKGVAQKTVNLSEIREFIVFQPPMALQREFACRVRGVGKLKTAQRTSLAEMDALFASLQHRAFRGEL